MIFHWWLTIERLPSPQELKGVFFFKGDLLQLGHDADQSDLALTFGLKFMPLKDFF